MKNYLYIIAACSLSLSAVAQDFHLSQYDQTTLYMNPATTGMFEGKDGSYRIATDYRSQWRALGTKPFTTSFISYDMPLEQTDNRWGVGGFVVNNNAVSGQFRTIQAMASGAYNIMKGSTDHYFTAGLQLGIIYKNFRPENLTFNEDYNSSSGTFEIGSGNTEVFSRTSLVRLDAGMGVYYKYIAQSEKYHPFGGLSVMHLNMPKESFTDFHSRLPMRWNVIAGSDFNVNDDLTLTPRTLFMYQGKAHEINAGMLAYYHIKNSTLDAMLGVDYRVKDAIVAHIGFRQGQHVFRFSYDINTSGLKAYSGARGAWEFSLVLVGVKSQPLFKPLF